MTAVPKRLLTPAEYLSRERAAPFRSEYYRGEMFAMAGTSLFHARIKENLSLSIGRRLQDSACEVLTSDLRVKVSSTGLYTYPDVIIVCGPPELEDDLFDTLLNPRVVIEVLPDSTEKYDRGAKFTHYKQVDSLQEYVLVAQDKPHVERFVRQPDHSWLVTDFAGIEAELVLTSVPLQIPLAEIYRRVTFPTVPQTTDERPDSSTRPEEMP